MPSNAGGILLPPNAGSILLAQARAAIASKLGLPAESTAGADWLERPCASFITLYLDEKLRGQAGTLEARCHLGEDLGTNALAAAFNDRRFKALTANEFKQVTIEISVLSPLEQVVWRSEADVLEQLRPGIDGVTFEYGHHRSIFLPQMWTEFNDPALFIGNLKYRGGLPPDFWDNAVKLSRFSAVIWRDGENR
jgi:hypothetical protein